MHKFQADEKSIQIKTTQKGSVIPIQLVSDQMRISQVLSNLLDNAVKYSTCQSQINVDFEYSEQASRVNINVTNKGLMIPRDEEYKLFKPLMTISTSMAERLCGVGLGLYTCRLIC